MDAEAMDVMLGNGKIANRRARARSVEKAKAAMEIRGIARDGYEIVYNAVSDVIYVYWFQESAREVASVRRD